MITKTLRQIAVGLVAGLAFAVAQASPINYLLKGQFDTGPQAGEKFSATYSYDPSVVAQLGDDHLALGTWTLNIFGQTYTGAEADDVPVATFLDGAFIGIDVSYSSLSPMLAFMNGGFSSDYAWVAYMTDSGDFGEGSYAVTQVPEPASLALVLGGLAVAGVARRRRQA
ncbi:PEP-CTERM sorting domain-containing protein [Pelomonas sp. SE-A7]|uniref:PEP-CTERM sorting domain-containing protein n=1 Tax=Pelomonas sp. SE-A7 TaxID=3054953 RepID=UPI00259CA371|nr:PEP-CTERM sorting domain-containing protein [Pelomonas sp. SE-A7]MDM4766277.1 PEP-CTERM sorting domain-containing protein [Pelomonas sp. SE-A7]